MRIPAAAALLAALACGGPPPELDYGGPVAGWSHTTGSEGGGQYSPLTQIGPGNVAHLEVAWTHRSGDVLEPRQGHWGTSLQVTPILEDQRL